MTKAVFRALALVLLLPAAHGFGHSGGTDANGCHAGSRPYHCHNSKGGSFEWDENATNVLVGVVVIAVIWYVVDRSSKRRSAARLAASPENKATEPLKALPLDSEASKPATERASVCRVPAAQDPAFRTLAQEVVHAATCRQDADTSEPARGQT